MNSNITPVNLMAAMPDVLYNDESCRALGAAAAGALAARTAEIGLLQIYSRIDGLPEALLDILAVDFNVGWYDAGGTVEVKRQTLKDSFKVHRLSGTKAAVERAMSAVYENTKVSEWFEYGGLPYCFKLLIDASFENIEPEKHRRVLGRVEFYKNARSRLDGVEYVAHPEGHCTVYASAGAAAAVMTIEAGVKVYGLG
jgi:phage tail P2-like protein